MKYIPADKLIAEIERLYNRAERRVTLEKEGLKAEDTRKYEDGLADAYDIILSFIASLQQEQPDVDLEKEIYNLYDGEYHDTEDVARHFYELGRRTKYQQDREEFAKLKAKEWQSGYDEGYLKGLNARREK